MSEGNFFARLFSRARVEGGLSEKKVKPGDFFRDAKSALESTTDGEIQTILDRVVFAQGPKPGAFLKEITVDDIRSATWSELPFPNDFSRSNLGGSFDDSQVFEARIAGYSRTVDINQLPKDAKIKVERREHEPRTQAEMDEPRPAEFVVKVMISPPRTESAYLIYSWDQITGGKKINSITPASRPITLLRDQKLANGQVLSKRDAVKAGFKVALIETAEGVE